MSEYICENPIAVDDTDGRAASITLCGKPATLWPDPPKEGVSQVALCPEHMFVAESQGGSDG